MKFERKKAFETIAGILCLIGLLAMGLLSMDQTIIFFNTAMRGSLGWIAPIAGACSDAGQYVFPIISEKKRAAGESCFMFVIATGIVFIMSVGTSIGVDMNEANYVKNTQGDAVLKTAQGSHQSKVLDAKSSEASSIQKQLDAKLASYDADCKAVDQKYAERLATAVKKNWINTPAQNGYEVGVAGIKVNIAKEKKALDTAIEKLRGELSAANGGMSSENDKLKALSDGLLPTEGAESLLQGIMTLTGCKNREKVNYIFWIIKEFIYQLLPFLFARGVFCLLFKETTPSRSPEKSGKDPIGQNEKGGIGKNAQTAKSNNDTEMKKAIGFDTSPPPKKDAHVEGKDKTEKAGDCLNSKENQGSKIEVGHYDSNGVDGKPANTLNSNEIQRLVESDNDIPEEEKPILRRYIAAMFMNVDKDGYVDGCKKIAARAGLTPYQGAQCRATLVNMRHNICVTEGGNTKLCATCQKENCKA